MATPAGPAVASTAAMRLANRSPVGQWRAEIVYNVAVQVYSVDKLMSEARRLAAQYRRATGRPLAISGEIAQHDAIRLLQLRPAPEDANGYDAVGQGEREGIRYLIKGRAILDNRKSGQRLGQLKLDQEWDRVLLVLLDANFSPFQILEADRPRIVEALAEAGDSNRARRGSLTVAKFRAISESAWHLEPNPDSEPC